MKKIFILPLFLLVGCGYHQTLPMQQPQQINVEIYVDVKNDTYVPFDETDFYEAEEEPEVISQLEIDKKVVQSEPTIKYVTNEVVKVCAADEIESILYIPKFSLVGMEDNKGKIIKASLDYIAAIESVVKQLRETYTECMLEQSKRKR